MKIKEIRSELLEAGDLCLSVDYEDGVMGTVAVNLRARDHTESAVLDAETIERAAEMLRQRRLARGDMAYVCPDHGLFGDSGHASDGCPICTYEGAEIS